MPAPRLVGSRHLLAARELALRLLGALQMADQSAPPADVLALALCDKAIVGALQNISGRRPYAESPPDRSIGESGDTFALSPRERGILRLISLGLSNKEIARELQISPETVKSHAKKLFAKLNARTRAQAVARGGSLNLV